MSAAAITRAPTPSQWTLGVLVVFAAVGFGFGNWLARLPAVRDHLGASTFEMSIIGLVMAAGAVLGLVFSGRIVVWIGPRRTMILAAIGQAIFMPLGVTLLWFGFEIPGMLALAAFGFSFSNGDVAMNVSGAAAERALGKPRMPLLHGGYSLGSVTAMGVGALAEVLQVPVPIHVAIVFGLIVTAVLIASRWIPLVESVPEESGAAGADPQAADPRDAAPHAAAPRGADSNRVNTNTDPVQVLANPEDAVPAGPERYNAWRDSRIIVIGLIVMSITLSEGTATDWLPLALTDARGFANEVAALALGTFYTAMLVTRAAGSWLLTRFGRVFVLRGSALISIAGIVLLYALPFPWVGFVCAALWGVGSALGFPIGVSAAADDPAKSVSGVATVSIIAYGAFLVGPMAIGIAGEHFGLLAAFLPLTLFLAFAAIAAGTAREPGARKA